MKTIGARLARAPAAWAAAGLLGGLSLSQEGMAAVVGAAFALGGAAAAIFFGMAKPGEKTRFGVLLAVGMTVGGFGAGMARTAATGCTSPKEALEPGTVLRESGRVLRVHTPMPGGARRGTADVRLAGGHSVRLVLPEGARPDLPGSRVEFSGTARGPRESRNPFEWDETTSLRAADIDAVVMPTRAPELLARAPWWHPRAFGERGRRWIAGTLTEAVDDEDRRAIVLGIVLGMREGMEVETRQAFRRAGAMHLFAVSGLHVGMVLGLLWVMLRPLALPRRRLALLLIPPVFAYALVTGWQPSAVRAAVMATVVLAGLALDRSPRLFNSLGAAAVVLLSFDPEQRLELGFQLTFAVVGALALFGVPMADKLSAWGRPDPFLPQDFVPDWQRRRWMFARIVSSSFAFAIAANIGSLPLTLHHFNLVTPSAPLVSILLVPVAWCVLALALCALVPAAVGWAWAAAQLGKVAAGLAGFALALCQSVERLPGAWFHPFRKPAGAAEMRVLDLDRGGQSMLLRQGRETWLIDTGNQHHMSGTVWPTFTHLGTVPPDSVLLTHADAQHRGGFQEMVRLGGHPSRMLLANPAARAVPFGETGSTLDILFPPDADWRRPRADDCATVWRWDVEGWRILGVGDAGFPTQTLMLEGDREAIACDVMVVGWHSRDLGLSTAFVAAAGPQVVVFQRPHASAEFRPGEALRRFIREQGITLVDLRDTGGIVIGIDPDALFITGHLTDPALRIPRDLPEDQDADEGG